MRYLTVRNAAIFVALMFVLAIGLMVLINAAPVAAQERTGVWEPDGSGTLCVNKGPLRMVKMTSVSQLDPFKCSGTGSYVAVQLYNFDAGQKDATVKVEGLSWEDAKQMLLQPPFNLDSGSFWYEPQNPPAGAPRIVKTSNVPSEPYGPNTFCAGGKPLTFNTIPSVSVLTPFKCAAAGTYSLFQVWRSGNENQVLFRVDGLTWEQALGRLKSGTENYDSGTLLFYPTGSQPAPTSAPSVPTLAPTVAPPVPTAVSVSTPAPTAGAPIITTTMPLTITLVSLRDATVGKSFSQVLRANGGDGPYQWSGDGLPDWISVESSGMITGTAPSTIGRTSQFDLIVRDTKGKEAIRTFSLDVKPAPGTGGSPTGPGFDFGAWLAANWIWLLIFVAIVLLIVFRDRVLGLFHRGVRITGPAVINQVHGVVATHNLIAAGGTVPHRNWRITRGALPAGVTITANTGALDFTAATVVGASLVGVTVDDSAGRVSTEFQLTVNLN